MFFRTSLLEKRTQTHTVPTHMPSIRREVRAQGHHSPGPTQLQVLEWLGVQWFAQGHFSGDGGRHKCNTSHQSTRYPPQGLGSNHT